MDTHFSLLLKDWRTRRNMSQLDLALAANVSARHISFLETGRAQPSRSMVIQLTETLEVPRGTRNTLLNAAGFAPAYAKRSLDDKEMAYIRSALDWTLDQHNPYPAMIFDRHWVLIDANQTASLFLAQLGLQVGDSFPEAILTSDVLRTAYENWPDTAHHIAQRLRTESRHAGGDAVLDAYADKLAQAAKTQTAHSQNSNPSAPLEAVLPTRLNMGGVVFSFFSTLTHFAAAEDIALADLKIELTYPADEQTRQALLSLPGPENTRPENTRPENTRPENTTQHIPPGKKPN